MNEAVALHQPASLGKIGRRVVPPIRAAGAALLVCIAYYLGARVGLALTFQSHAVSTLWPANAILLAALLLAPARWWWLFLLAAFPAHLAAELQAGGVPLRMVLCWYVSNSCEALIGAIFVRRFAATPRLFDSFRRISTFFAFAAFLAPFLSSFLDAAFVQLNNWGRGSYWEVWQMRFFSNVLVNLTLVPVIVTWTTGGIASLRETPPRRYAEACLLAIGLLAVGIAVFSAQRAGPGTTPALLYAPLPFLMWAAVRFGPRGASTSLLLIVLLAIWGAVHGRGPFVAPSVETNALSLQLLFIVIAITLLSLAALIREREQAEDTARWNGEQLQLALDAAQLGTWDWHIPDDTAVWSDTSMRIVGLTGGDRRIARERFYGAIHPDDRLAVSRAVRRARESGAPYESEFRVLRPDGSVRWVLGKGEVQYDRAGRPTRILGVNADITERKRAEALSAGQSRVLEMIATGASLPDVLTSLVTLVESQSAGLLCSVLLSEDGVHMHHGAASSLPESFVQADDAASIGPQGEARGVATYVGKTFVTSDILTDPRWEGSRELASQYGLRTCWSNPIVSQEGQVLGSFAMYTRDVRGPSPEEAQLIDLATQIAGIAIERQRAEEALRESQQRYRLATASASVGVWDWNLETNDMYVDSHLKAILGYQEHEIGNRIEEWRRLVYPEDADRVIERARAHISGESSQYDVEHRMLHRDGSVRWFLARGSVVRDKSGKPCRLVGTDTDVTERKRAEVEAQEQRRQLAHLGRVAMLGELSGALAHELNQPLSAIMANVGAAQRFLAQSTPDMDEVRQILQDIVHDDQRAGEVILRLRALMKKEELRLQLLGLNEVLGDVLDLLHSDLIQRQVSVDSQLAPSLPPVLADRVQLQQVLLNLIINACDAMSAHATGERRINLTTVLAPDGSVLLSVADRGTGIAEGELDRIFEPFVTSKEHGMGLGLTICRSIVEAHGGRLQAVNNPDGGATFHLALPGAEPDRRCVPRSPGRAGVATSGRPSA